jgi:hypothetical protein
MLRVSVNRLLPPAIDPRCLRWQRFGTKERRELLGEFPSAEGRDLSGGIAEGVPQRCWPQKHGSQPRSSEMARLLT